MPMPIPFHQLGALARFEKTSCAMVHAERMVDQANNFQVDEVIDGIENWFKSEGVPYGHFIELQREKARARHAKVTANVRRTRED